MSKASVYREWPFSRYPKREKQKIRARDKKKKDKKLITENKKQKPDGKNEIWVFIILFLSFLLNDRVQREEMAFNLDN